MGHLIAVVLAMSLQAETGPVNVWTGSAPSGTCKGNRVVVTTSGLVYSCVTGTWAQKVEQAVATPTFSPVAGSYNGTQSVTISDATGGATIYYTTDGSTPTTASSTYSTPVSVAATKTVKAIAALAGYATSSVGSAPYTITSPSLNAVLYASFTAPGLYSTGDTTLAVNGAGAAVAATFTRASAATMTDAPGVAGATWWRAATSGQLRVSAQWEGALIEPGKTNVFATPTDSPTSSGNWSLIAAGPTLTANNQAFIDPTTTGTAFTESAGVVSGFQQSVTTTAQAYTVSIFVKSSSTDRQCVGIASDSTVYAKFDVVDGAVTYKDTSTSVWAGVAEHSGLWHRIWMERSYTAAAHNIQFYATANCYDNSMSATGGTMNSFWSHAQMEAGSLSSYTPTGTVRATDVLTFPVSMADGNACIGLKALPYNGSWDSRQTSALMGAFASGSAFSSANSIFLWDGGNTNTVNCWVYDGSAVSKTVVMNKYPGSYDKGHVYKCCTNTSGTVTLSYDGGSSSISAGAGTGILSAPIATISVGTASGGAGFNGLPVAVTDVIACNVSDPSLCGDYYLPSSKHFAVIGDSISTGVQGLMATQSWVNTAATTSGANIGTMVHGGWKVSDGLAALKANLGHRYSRIAVAMGTNEGAPGGSVVEQLNEIGMMIQSIGATPIIMTIPPRGLTGSNEADRLDANLKIQALCARRGWVFADSATAMNDPSNTGFLRAADDTGDHVHPNATGEVRLGTFMAPFFQ